MDFYEIFQDAVFVAIGANGAVYALAALGLNLHFGYTGLLNFGHVAFMMVGAYGLAITVVEGGPFWLGIVLGILSAVVLALILGLPTLRLRADYLAITTIAAQEMLRLLFRSQYLDPITRSVFGIQGFAGAFYRANPYPRGQHSLGIIDVSERTLWVITAGWGTVAVCATMLWLLDRSPWGRVLKSIREDEDAARSLGKNVFGYKLQSLVVGGVFGALGGILLALDFQNVNPDAFVPVTTFFLYVVVILGGAGTPFGPVAGAVIFWFVIELARGTLASAVGAGYITGLDSQDIAAMRFVLVGLGLVLLMAFRPQGIFGSREEMLLDAR